MSEVNVRIKMNSELKEQFEKICTDAGFSVNEVLCEFARKTVDEQKFPFEVRD